MTFYYYIINAKTNKIFIQNNLSSITHIAKQIAFGLISKIKYDNYFQIFDCNLTMKFLN